MCWYDGKKLGNGWIMYIHAATVRTGIVIGWVDWEISITLLALDALGSFAYCTEVGFSFVVPIITMAKAPKFHFAKEHHLADKAMK